MSSEYWDPKRIEQYLGLVGQIPHRTEGESVLLEILPLNVHRVLDIGTGDGRMIALLRAVRSDIEAIGIDFSPIMLEKATTRFQGDSAVQIVNHNIDHPLPDLGTFDMVVSSFAIHHVSDSRKKALYAEVFEILNPGGLFANLEHVSSPTDKLHEDFYSALGMDVSQEDASNQCAPVEPQLDWLRDIGFLDVDCYWKWRELALLAGFHTGIA